MKKRYFCIFLSLIAFSCSGRFLSPQEIALLSAPSSYCDVLHIPSAPYPVIEPRPYLGIYLASKKLEQSIPACKINSSFVQVAGVIRGTPAAKAGLKNDDIILSISGSPVCSDEEHVITSFKDVIDNQTIGSQVELDILRNDQKITLTVRLEEMPTHEQQEAQHRDIGKCVIENSMLDDALRAQDALPAFNTLLDELYRKSNTVHNPGAEYEKESHPLQLNEVTYMMRHPLAAGEAARELSQRITASLHERDLNTGDIMRRTASLLEIDLSLSKKPAEVTFPALLQAMQETGNRVEESLSNLTNDERKLLLDKAIHPWDDDQWNTIVEISMKVDRAKLFNAFSSLFSFLTNDNLSLLKEDIIKRFGENRGPVIYEAMTPAGRVIVGGTGPNVYADDAALILDLGGDDVYLNNAGGTRPGMPVALLIDFGGKNRYISKENFSQGAGVLGGGFLIDLGKGATFSSLDGSQGAGFWGIGFLYHGDGDGVYSARKFSQGTGQMGIGLILNGNGDNRYFCSYGGQGLGLFGGAGVLLDEGGKDFYELGGLEPDFRDPEKSTVSLGQGFGHGVRTAKETSGVPGGIGVLIDEAGDDTYIADYFSQGASYYYGAGILNDRDGDDQYISGRYSQGAGIHSSVGILEDEKGNDFYYASFGVAQGMGHDFGVGFFVDDGGDDFYWGGTLVQGAATNGSLGLFIDMQGKDQLMSISKGQAYAEEKNSMGIKIGKGHENDEAAINIGIRKE